jgi:predicted nuclease of restriction endonuclease-like (RecB) superfamily
MDRSPANQEEYGKFLAELRQRIADARLAAARSVNRQLILHYWDIGRSIVERSQTVGRGESIIERLAEDLRSTGPGNVGYSAQNLHSIRQFYEEYSAPGFRQQAAGKSGTSRPSSRRRTAGTSESHKKMPRVLAGVPWEQHLLILDRVKEPAARIYYLRASARLGWSRDVLLNQIKAQVYEGTPAGKKAQSQ